MWMMGIQAQALWLAEQVLYPLSHPLTPKQTNLSDIEKALLQEWGVNQGLLHAREVLC